MEETTDTVDGATIARGWLAGAVLLLLMATSLLTWQIWAIHPALTSRVIRPGSIVPAFFPPTESEGNPIAHIDEVRGQLYKEPPQIKTGDPFQIKVSRETPVLGLLLPESEETISWQEAVDHVDEVRFVEGDVVGIERTSAAAFIEFEGNRRGDFKAFIPAVCLSSFPHDLDELLEGKRVRLAGHIQDYQGRPRIVLMSPSQVEVIGTFD